MSKFVQRFTPGLPAVAAVQAIAAIPPVAAVEFYVNLYQEPNGHIRPGARIFRTEVNARAHAGSDSGNVFLGVEKLVVVRAS